MELQFMKVIKLVLVEKLRKDVGREIKEEDFI